MTDTVYHYLIFYAIQMVHTLELLSNKSCLMFRVVYNRWG